MRISSLALSTVSALLLRADVVWSFAPSHSAMVTAATTMATNNRRGLTQISLSSLLDGNSLNNDESFDIEAARRYLESMMKRTSHNLEEQESRSNLFDVASSSAAAAASTSSPRFATSDEEKEKDDTVSSSASPSSVKVLTSSSSTSHPVVLPPPPVLTSMDRVRRQTEVGLLSQLDQGDDVLGELWALWFRERGPKAAKKLFEAEELTGRGPRYWDEAEQSLLELIDEHSVHWAEPVNRLATLYYMQGKLEQAEQLCWTVLAVKPWHFGALSGIVLVYEGMHDTESAQVWAARRLPAWSPSGPNRRRAAWVEKAVKNAEQLLVDAERRVVEAFGKPDDHTNGESGRHRLKAQRDDNHDAWQ